MNLKIVGYVGLMTIINAGLAITGVATPDFTMGAIVGVLCAAFIIPLLT